MRLVHRWARWVALLALLVAIGLLFGPVLDDPFLHWDDSRYVTGRAPLRRIAGGEVSGPLARLLSPADALAGRFWEYFPLRDATYAFDAWRGAGHELAARPFHQTNLVLHVLNVLLVYGLARRLALAWPLALAAAALFGVHPLIVEPVAWISARKDLLYTGLTLLALFLVLPAASERDRFGKLRALGIALAVLGAMLSKGPGVMAVPLAAWFVVAGVSAGERNRRWKVIIALTPVALVWTMIVLEIGRRNALVSLSGAASLSQRATLALGAPAYALSRVLLPVGLSPSYRAWPDHGPWSDAHAWASLLLVALAVLLWRRYGKALLEARETMLVGAFVLAVLPTSGVVAVSQPRADRFLYLVVAMTALLLTQLLSRGLQRFAHWPWAVLAVALGLFVLQTRSYLPVWRADVSLWKHVLAQDAEHPLANGALGALALEQGHLDVAKRLLDRAVASGPQIATTWSNLGHWWCLRAGAGPLRRGQQKRAYRLEQAEQALRRAAMLDPRAPSPLAQLGLIAWWRGRPQVAETLLRRALALPEPPPRAGLDLADLLLEQGRTAQSRRLRARTCRQHPRLGRCQTGGP